MKTYIFADNIIFKKLYDTFFAMRVFHRENDQGQILVKFITKNIEKELLKYEIIKQQLTEIHE